VIGDYGRAGDVEAAVAQLVTDWSPDLIITTGDNNYPDGEATTIDANIGQYYAGFIYPYQGAYGPGAVRNRFFPSPGNHDWHTADLAPYLDYFELPGNERYYDFVRGPVHFFALDSDSNEPDGVNQDSVQARWLRQGLGNSISPWKIVYMHHAPYSSAQHGDTDWMQLPFAEWGASAVLSGHDHVYEHLVVDGLDYFTIGLGGYPARYIFLLPKPGSQLRYNDAYGAMLVEATDSRLVFQFVNVSGEVVDQVVLMGTEGTEGN
jgi:tartrate-resistant acid phosphatase type 5